MYRTSCTLPSSRQLFYKVNVEGTKTLISACREAEVEVRMLTSYSVRGKCSYIAASMLVY